MPRPSLASGLSCRSSGTAVAAAVLPVGRQWGWRCLGASLPPPPRDVATPGAACEQCHGSVRKQSRGAVGAVPAGAGPEAAPRAAPAWQQLIRSRRENHLLRCRSRRPLRRSALCSTLSARASPADRQCCPRDLLGPGAWQHWKTDRIWKQRRGPLTSVATRANASSTLLPSSADVSTNIRPSRWAAWRGGAGKVGGRIQTCCLRGITNTLLAMASAAAHPQAPGALAFRCLRKLRSCCWCLHHQCSCSLQDEARRCYHTRPTHQCPGLAPPALPAAPANQSCSQQA